MLFFKTLKGVKFNPNPNPASTQHFLFTFITLSTKNFCLMLAVRLILMTPGSFYTTKSFSLIVLCAIRRRTCRIKSQVGPRKKRGFIVELRASLQRAGGDVGSGATDNCSRAIFAESIDRSRPPSRADLMCTSRAASVSTILSSGPPVLRRLGLVLQKCGLAYIIARSSLGRSVAQDCFLVRCRPTVSSQQVCID